MTEDELLRWARYYAVLTERFPPDIYKELRVRPRKVAQRDRRVYDQPRQGTRKGTNVH